MDEAPYDNVEFPVRKPGTGTWPGPGQHSSAGKIHAQHSSSKSGPKLAPVMESTESVEIEDQRNQAKVISHSHTPGSVTLNTSYTSSSNRNPQQTSQPVPVTAVTPVAPMPTTPNSPSKVAYHQQKNNTLKAGSMDEKVIIPMVDVDFSLLSPSSKTPLDDSYTKHRHFHRLNDRIIRQSELLTDVSKSKKHGKPGEILSYEQLIQGMLVDGEKLLLGSCWLHFSSIEFLEPEKLSTIKQPIGRGRICLTNKRVLILSAENNITDLRLKEFGKSTLEADGGYKLEASTYNSIFYQNLPLTSFHSAELRVEVGNCVESKIQKKKPVCCGLCGCVGVGRCTTSWYASPPMTAIFNRRELRLGVAMPPWHTKTTFVIHLQPDMPVTSARDFVAQLQVHAPHMQ